MANTLYEIDFNLRHYVGENSDVIKDVKNNIKNYLRNPNIPDFNRNIYSAIYNALTYYENIANLSTNNTNGSKSFLEQTIEEFEKDFKYLSNLYNPKDLSKPSVIFAKARIKSPISALDKILEKVSEYVHEGRDLSKITESLRDFIGLRIIVDPPNEIKEKGKQAESDFCYEVFNELLKFRGIYRQINNEYPQDTDYNFISVNTLHDPNKLKKLKQRPKKEGFIYTPEEVGVYIPENRPHYLEDIDQFLKDYRMYPKANLYQRLHVCASPFYSKTTTQKNLPSFIIPPSSENLSIEYQFCSIDEEKYAEYGKSAHNLYKSNTNYHRLAVPLFIKTDFLTQTMRLARFDESMKEFYGYTFESMFNIDFETFSEIFDRHEQDEILARNLIVEFDKDNSDYRLSPSKNILVFTETQSPNFVENLLKNATPEELKKFYDINNISSGTIYPKGKQPVVKHKKVFKVLTLHSADSKEKHTISENDSSHHKKKIKAVSYRKKVHEYPDFE